MHASDLLKERRETRNPCAPRTQARNPCVRRVIPGALCRRMPARARYARPLMRSLLLARLLALSAACATACAPGSDDPDVDARPSASQITDAKARLQAALAGAAEIREVLERIGLLPTYTCGEPRGNFVADAVGSMQARYSCATVTLDAGDPARDVITVAFPTGGCELGGALFVGSMIARVSGGDDTFALELDPRDLTIDGNGIAAVGGYGSCGDASRYWASATGTAHGKMYAIDVEIEERAGVPFLSSTMLAVDGTMTLTDASGTDTVTLDGVQYEVGDLFPTAGTIVVQTASGHRISATFSSSSVLTGNVRVVIDAHEAVTIPIPA
jgi:hypothetical protein